MKTARMILAALGLTVGLISVAPVYANEVKVVDARASRSGNGTYSFSVTLLHADNGWDHYADRWQVLSPDGKILATRVLMHPHDSEQPFTRGMSGVKIPKGLSWVNIRAHDKVHGDGPVLFRVELP